MTIIHLVLGKANPNRMNGVSKVAHYLATFQARQGQDTAVWGITGSPEEMPQDREYSIRLFPKGSTAFGIAADLKHALSELDPRDTIIHLHGGFIPVFYGISSALKKYGLRYVFSPHGSLSPFALRRGLKKRLYFHFLEKHLIQGAEAVHFLGKWQADAFDNFITLNKKVVIPNGQNLTELQVDGEVTYAAKSRPIFSFCGRLISHYKGLDVLLRAFYRYTNLGGDGVLWLIGDGTDRAKLEKLVSELNLREKVVFWGSRFGNEKLGLLNSSDIFVHPSRSEGLPTSVLEAAGMGLPCIVSKATNMGEPLAQADAGLLLENLEVNTVANSLIKMEQYFREGRLPRMGAKAASMVKKSYNWKSISELMVKQLYAIDHGA